MSAVGFGERAKRFAMIVDDLKVSSIFLPSELVSSVISSTKIDDSLCRSPTSVSNLDLVSDLPVSRLFKPSYNSTNANAKKLSLDQY